MLGKAIACGLLVATGVASGCGGGVTITSPSPSEPTLDPAILEPQLREKLSKDAGVDPAEVAVSCPSGEPLEEGHMFECTLTAPDGSTASVRVTVTSAVVSSGQLRYHVDAVVPRSQFK